VNLPVDHYLSPPAACERLEQMVARFGGSLLSTSSTERVDYALPAHASAEISAFLRPQSTANFESACVAQLPGGRVFGSGNILAPDGQTIARDVSPDFGKPFEDHWLLAYKKIRRPVPIPGTTAVIATTLGAGYSHWLLDELPRLLALEPDTMETLIAHSGSSYNREALALRGFSGNVIPAKRYAHFACDELIVPSLGRLIPTTVCVLEEFTAPLRLPFSSFGERLYISRARARRRRIANEAELWTQLSPRGFVKLELEELTWQQQINAFLGAKIVIAPHGAGLANLVFCAPGTKVIELFHRSYVNGCFWQLAALKELDYRPLVPSSSEPLAQTLSGNRVDIGADIAQILQALSD
jgi:hypothetical protein